MRLVGCSGKGVDEIDGNSCAYGVARGGQNGYKVPACRP